MPRRFAFLVALVGLCGCGESVATREVPVSASRPESSPPATDPATKSPRAIATH